MNAILTALTSLPPEFPEALPLVRYFLQEINSPAWITFFRIALIAIVAISAAIVILHGRNSKN